MRDKFEEWAKDYVKTRHDPKPGKEATDALPYTSPYTQAAWEAWQASWAWGALQASEETERLRAALEELTGACEVEFESDQTGDDPDDEPVGGGLDQEGKPDWMNITFGMIRRARAALTP